MVAPLKPANCKSSNEAMCEMKYVSSQFDFVLQYDAISG